MLMLIFKKNIFTFLIIILSLNSLNTLAMKPVKYAQKIDMQKINSIVEKIKSAYDIPAMFGQNIAKEDLAYLIGSNDNLFGYEYQHLNNQELELLLELLKNTEIERIKNRLEIDKYGYLIEQDLKLMLEELKNLQATQKTKSLTESINKKILEVNRKKLKTESLMDLAKKAGKTFSKSSQKPGPTGTQEVKPAKPTTLFSGKTKKEMLEFNEFQ